MKSSRRASSSRAPGAISSRSKIETRSGVYGVGDATLNGRELAVAAYLQEHLIPNLIGRDAGRIEDTWQFFYRGAYWRRGPVTMTAIAAVDVALWDILGKMTGQPLYQLLGGRSREGALVYGHANGRDIAETSAEVGRYIEMGYKAIRAQSGVPGLSKTYGVSNMKTGYEPAESALPAETVWNTTKYLNTVPQLFERLRAGSRPRRRAAARRASSPHADRGGAPRARSRAVSALLDGRLDARGEPERVRADPQAHRDAAGRGRGVQLRSGIASISSRTSSSTTSARPSCTPAASRTFGGSRISRPCMPCARASTAPRISRPVCMGAALHFDAWVPNFGIQEYMHHSPETLQVFPHDYTFRDGRLFCGESPGHGVDIDEKLAAKYPYSPKQLPIARLEDGSMWDW